jgi:REP element-mobilizing transposase RayT
MQKIVGITRLTASRKLLFKFVDSLLDGEPAVRHFENEAVAQLVVNAFLYFAEERYKLLAFVVMPSHHHWLFLPIPSWCEQLAARQSNNETKRSAREVISHSMQSFTGTQCNRLLSLSGSFWQMESFDHYARDEAEVMRIMDYIENNPLLQVLYTRLKCTVFRLPTIACNTASNTAMRSKKRDRLPACHSRLFSDSFRLSIYFPFPITDRLAAYPT